MKVTRQVTSATLAALDEAAATCVVGFNTVQTVANKII